jgi:hypothetical protein
MIKYIESSIEGRKPKCEKTGKIIFDKKTGITKINYLKKEGKGNKDYYRVYQCEFCDFWHITSSKMYEDEV